MTTTQHRISKGAVAVLVASTALLTCLTSCGSREQEAPALVFDVDTCDHCRMLISEPAYAAAYRIGDREMVFDDIGCLVARLSAEEEAGSAEIWVHDVEDHDWLSAAAATFVQLPDLATPMASGIVAVRDAEHAAMLVDHHPGGRIASFTQLAERERKSGKDIDAHAK